MSSKSYYAGFGCCAFHADLFTLGVGDICTLGGGHGVADNLLVHEAVQDVRHPRAGRVLVIKEAHRDGLTTHLGHGHRDCLDQGAALLPGHVSAVILVTSPDLIVI